MWVSFGRYSLNFGQAGTIYGLVIWKQFFRSVRKYFLVGACTVWKQVYLFIFLASIRSEFLLRGVSVHILVFVTLSLFIMVSWGHRGGVQFWKSCMLMACNFINNGIFCAFTGLLSVGECISSKSNGQPLFLLEMNFIMDIRYFSSSFYHAVMLQ